MQSVWLVDGWLLQTVVSRRWGGFVVLVLRWYRDEDDWKQSTLNAINRARGCPMIDEVEVTRLPWWCHSAGIISETLQELSENKHIDNLVFVWKIISA